MLKRAAGKIYGWIEPHMDNDKMLTKIKRVYICTDAAARDKCAEMYTDIIAKILLTLLVTCILAVILVAKEAFAPHQCISCNACVACKTKYYYIERKHYDA